MIKKFDVTIVETLKMRVSVEADSPDEAKQIVSDKWYKGEYILDAECFEGVEFKSSEPVFEPNYMKKDDCKHSVSQPKKGKNNREER